MSHKARSASLYEPCTLAVQGLNTIYTPSPIGLNKQLHNTVVLEFFIDILIVNTTPKRV